MQIDTKQLQMDRKPLATKMSTKRVDAYTAEDGRSGEISKLFLVFWDHFTR